MDARLYQQHAVACYEGDKLIEEVDQIIAKAEALIDPRRQFNNWLRSVEGQEWRDAEFAQRGGICAYCGNRMRKPDAVVHHVKPLAHHGEAANIPSNYRLLHPHCNRKIGTKIVELRF
ncbi:MAG: HNH endonuclease signature motif containing protein [Cyanobacteria bacterium P01_G01_bin.54]